jgi:predicted DCC family thiol-disulfide oxidoreductase YuxK
MGRVPVEMVDFQQPGALERFPGLTHEACLQAMQLVTPDGRIFSGFEAGVQALATRPVLGRLVSLYYLPGLRRLLDRVYRIVAANRYRIMGRALARGGCPGGSCALHLPQKREKK